ncbi:MAG: hypothetical protein ACR2G3_03005 [Solirubrobacterales bacterium]
MTTVAILAAVYFLIVRPILDTTERTATGISSNISQSQQRSAQRAAKARIEAARNSATSYANSFLAGTQPWTEASKAVLTCVKQAGDSIAKLERCKRLGQDIASGVLSDRNFAVSYADSLEAQGDTTGAAQVRSCVEKAGYEARPMEACRRLADQLLFG